ncbi:MULTISPECIES: hypothetical protein [Streptomyces]|uniref:Uncharacterized protein n=1 Tax=Streptomyces kaempferi TaxID=333725 RepID=A0ABW3XQJ6_9ACTN|nr:hypothetical protein [Streptomyces sp. NBC_01462]
MKEIVRGYWCECRTEDLAGGGPPALLASMDTYSAAQADRWIAVALRTITPALGPAAADEAWDWLYDGRIEMRQALLRSEPCSVSVDNKTTRLTWTARPVLFLTLARREDAGLPDCADRFTPGTGRPRPRLL